MKIHHIAQTGLVILNNRSREALETPSIYHDALKHLHVADIRYLVYDVELKTKIYERIKSPHKWYIGMLSRGIMRYKPGIIHISHQI